MNDKLTLFVIHLLGVAVAITGCAQHDQEPEQQFGRVGIQASALTQPFQITAVVIESGTSSATLSYDNAKGAYTGALVLPVGTQSITGKAYAGAQQVGIGTADVFIEANQTSALTLRVLDTTGGPPQPDAGPFITSLTSSAPSAETGRPITLQVNALDANGDPLNYAWTSTCGGTFSAQAAATNFQTDVVGACKVTSTVTSNSLRDSESFDFFVFAPNAAQGAANVDVVYVPHAAIDSIQVMSGAQDQFYCSISPFGGDAMCPNAIAKQKLAISINYVNYGGFATVTSTDTCGGTFEPVAPWFFYYTPGRSGMCTLTASLTRDESSTSLAASFYIRE